ncbi:hypothetical protein LTR56_020333 [Elasticomyces elasticus]|nr:hypothetical protein LTR56_020333 [Elasticomyces elasticus]KAK3655610.1 hypothetical protein LTR22_010200 [Elasticomyces elasticus]KAK4910268.1 hypothetical protein LTR49_021014 [Elasticomyces elasticus]KAK5764841.1 hypothetical protein LTS12_005111 [Elasticomyces elasticus]
MDYVPVQQALHPAYRPLNQHTKEIRLLAISPSANEADLVRCDVLDICLNSSDSHEYETISYAWGASKDRRTLILNDVPLSVPIESERALRRMRFADKHRTLWIDSICINQANNDERGQQVAIMRDIYRYSGGNLIYLGDEDSLVESAVENMNLTYEEMRLQTNDFTAMWHILYYSRKPVQHTKESPGAQLNPEAFMDLTGRPWFSRLWIFQEATDAPSNRCYAGRHEFDLLLVLRVAAWLGYQWRWYPTNLTWGHCLRRALSLFDHADHQHGLYSATKLRRTFYDLLVTSSYRQTSDPRDRLFGMLGLVDQLPNNCKDASHLVTPDYWKDITEVQRNATRYAILEENTLNILALVKHSEASLAEDVSSWAVKLEGSKDDEVGPPLWKQVHAPNGRLVDPKLVLPDAGLDDPEILSLLGIVSDVAIEIGEVFASEVLNSAETFRRALLTTEQLTSRRTTLSAEDMFRVLVAGIGAPGESLTYPEAQQMAASWESCKESRSPVSEELRSHIAMFAVDRCVFATANGALGLGPAMTAAGDLVTVLDGGALLYVLRPEKSSYRFVGVCYVPDIMHGTTVHDGEDGQKQIFDLR